MRQLKDRLITVQMHDLHARGADGHDVPWGTGVGQTEAVLRELHRLGIRPTMFGLEYSYNWLESMPEIAKCVAFFNQVSLRVAGESLSICSQPSTQPQRLCWKTHSPSPRPLPGRGRPLARGRPDTVQ